VASTTINLDLKSISHQLEAELSTLIQSLINDLAHHPPSISSATASTSPSLSPPFAGFGISIDAVSRAADGDDHEEVEEVFAQHASDDDDDGDDIHGYGEDDDHDDDGDDDNGHDDADAVSDDAPLDSSDDDGDGDDDDDQSVSIPDETHPQNHPSDQSNPRPNRRSRNSFGSGGGNWLIGGPGGQISTANIRAVRSSPSSVSMSASASASEVLFSDEFDDADGDGDGVACMSSLTTFGAYVCRMSH
jgi:hypothetical protein